MAIDIIAFAYQLLYRIQVKKRDNLPYQLKTVIGIRQEYEKLT